LISNHYNIWLIEPQNCKVEKNDFGWNDILHGLASVKDVTAEISGKNVISRSEMKGCAGKFSRPPEWPCRPR